MKTMVLSTRLVRILDVVGAGISAILLCGMQDVQTTLVTAVFLLMLVDHVRDGDGGKE